MRAAMTLALLAAGTARAGTVWLSWPDDPGPCGFDQMASALRARLPAQTVEAGRHALEPGSAQVALGREGTDWLLEVQTEGSPALKRKLSNSEGDCLAFSERASLVVDRYLEDLHWTGEAAALEKPASPPAPELAAVWHGIAELELGGGAGLAGATPMGGVSVGVQRGTLSALVEISTQPQAQWTFSDQDVISTRDIVAQARLGLGMRLPHGTIRLELLPGTELFLASTNKGTSSSPVFHREANAVASPFLGGRLAYAFPLSARFYGSLAIQGRYLLIGRTFGIYGYPSDSVAPPRTYVEGTVGLGYLFF